MPDRFPRSVEIDLLRVLAIVLMILYHLLYDLNTYENIPIDVFGPFWKTVERGTAGIILFLTGLCFVISWKRSRSRVKFLRRGLRILGYALIVSVATFIVDPETYVRFGILHLIGTATIVLPLFAPLRYWNVLLGMIVIALSAFITQGTSSTVLLPLGLTPPGFRTVDYFPLIPWLGVILIGVACGFVYREHPAYWTCINPHQSSAWRRRAIAPLRLVSERSLLIYMLHQPLLLLILRALPLR